MSRPRRSTLAPSLRIGLYALDGAQRLVLNTLGVLSVLLVAGPLCVLHFAPQSRVLDWVTIHFTQLSWDSMDQLEIAEENMISDLLLRRLYPQPPRHKPRPQVLSRDDSGIFLPDEVLAT